MASRNVRSFLRIDHAVSELGVFLCNILESEAVILQESLTRKLNVTLNCGNKKKMKKNLAYAQAHQPLFFFFSLLKC